MNSIQETLATYKPTIDQKLQDFLLQKSQDFSDLPWADTVFNQLQQMVSQGKTVRGSLVVFTQEQLAKTPHPDAVTIAAALELAHASLLIHDDVMDRDALRRGQPTMYKQYIDQSELLRITEPNHFGMCMGTAVGIIANYLSHDLLAQVTLGRKTIQKIQEVFLHTLTQTTFAQMQDVYGGLTHNSLTRDEIIQLYSNKTAQYTFSLPFTLGCILADSNQETRQQFRELGICLGVLFQIKDDELGLFGNEKQLGKPVGSDIAERKQTIYYHYLFEYASKTETEKLQAIFGNHTNTEQDLQYVRDCIHKHNISEKVQEHIAIFKQQTQDILSQMLITKEHQQILLDMLSFIMQRSR